MKQVFPKLDNPHFPGWAFSEAPPSYELKLYLVLVELMALLGPGVDSRLSTAPVELDAVALSLAVMFRAALVL